MACFYAALDVLQTASEKEIRSAYRRRALATHPDKGGSSADFLLVVKAFETLCDVQRRRAYDQKRAQHTSTPSEKKVGHTRGSKSTSQARDAAACDPTAGKRRRRTAPPPKQNTAGHKSPPCKASSSELLRELLSQKKQEWRARLKRLDGDELHAIFKECETARSAAAAESTASHEQQGNGSEPFHQDEGSQSSDSQESATDGPPCERDWPLPLTDMDAMSTDVPDASAKGTSRNRSSKQSSPVAGISKTRSGYVARVELYCLRVYTQAVKDLDVAIDMHVSLVRFRQLVGAAIDEGVHCTEAVQQAIGIVSKERAETNSGAMKCSYMLRVRRVGNKTFSTTRDILEISDPWSAVVKNIKQRREKREQRKARLPTPVGRLQQLAGQILSSRYRQRWGVSELPPGLEMVSFREKDDRVCARLTLQDGTAVSGPIRCCIPDAQQDLHAAQSLQQRKGDQAACEELQRRDLEVMVKLLTTRQA